MNKTADVLKKVLKVILWVVAGFMMLLILVIVLIQIPAIQTKIVHEAASFVSSKTNTKVEIGNLRISFPKSILIKDLYLEDIKADTLVYAGEVRINIALLGLLKNKIQVNSFMLDEAVLNLARSETDSLFNFNFLINAFSDTTNQAVEKVENEEKAAWSFSIDKVDLRKIRFLFNDSYAGMNVSLAVAKLEVKMDEIDLDASIYDIDKLIVEHLVADVLITKSSESSEEASENLPKISAKEIQISDTRISYEDSLINQSVVAEIHKFILDNGAINLEEQTVSTDRLRLSQSSVAYNTRENEIPDTTETTDSPEPESNEWAVIVQRIDLEDNSLKYNIVNKPEISQAFDVNHIDLKELTLKAKDFQFSPVKTEVAVNEFTAINKDGFTISGFETDFRMDQQSITADNLKISTQNSSIDADVNLQFSSMESLSDSLQNLVINLDMRNVSISNADILYFSPDLSAQPFFSNARNVTSISGTVSGPVSQLKGENILVETGFATVLRTDFNINGLPDAETAYFDFPDLSIVTKKRDIQMLAGSYIPDSIGIPENLDVQIAFKGRMKSFESTVEMNSSFGSAELYATIDNYETFNATLNINSFDVGSVLMDTVMFGPVTLTAETSGQGLDLATINAKINAEASQLFLNGYNYQNLIVDGTINGQGFEGKVNLNDEYAVFEFDGLVNLDLDQEKYAFRFDLQGADLQKLNFTEDDIRIAMVVDSDLQDGRLEKLNGTFAIANIIIARDNDVYKLDSLLFASVNESDVSTLDFSSALIDMKYSGTISPIALSAELSGFINNYFQFSDSIQETTASEPVNFDFEIQIHNHPILSEVFLPELNAFEPGIITGSFDSESNNLEINATLKTLVYGQIEIKDLVLDVNSSQAELNYSLSGSSVSNEQFSLDNLLLEGKLADNVIFAGVTSTDEDQSKKFAIHSQLTRQNDNYRLALDPDDFYLMYKQWNIAADNYVEFGDEGVLIHNLFMNNNTSEINLTSVNQQFNDDISIGIKNFLLDDISRIIEKDTTFVKGVVDAEILLKQLAGTYGVIADVEISDLVVREVPVGKIDLKADNPEAGRFDIELNLTGVDNNLTAEGYFIPESEEDALNIELLIESLSMKTVEAFAMGQISEAEGTLSGNFTIQGKTDAPEITGELVFNDVFMNPALLNNRLEIRDETIRLQADGIYFSSFTILDADGQPAVIDGSVKMTNFADYVFALKVDANDFLLFNTSAADNESFFGTMIIDSKIDVEGPMELPVINANIKVMEGSNFTFAIPEDQLTTDRGEDVVEFLAPENLNPIIYRDEEETETSVVVEGIDLSAIIEVDENATLRLLMDPSSADSLVVKGEAALSFGIDRSGKMSLTGAYNLHEGSYLVSLQSVIKRQFDILEGSTIIWTGDPMNAGISLNARYTVRAAPYDLVASQISGLSDVERGSYKQQYPFWVLLKLRGEILKPQISFEIQLPPEEKGILGGAVDQKLTLLNEDESALNKQVFALLVMGRFIQENPFQTESGGTSAMVRSTVGGFLSAQLNKLTEKAIPGVELDFNIQSYDDYQTGEAVGRTEVELGVRKQLFDERVTVKVGGAIDVEGEQAKQNAASDIASDVEVEYRLTDDGRYKLKGFRQNQYEGALEGQLVETGVGFVYERDFNKWKNFFRSPKTEEDSRDD
ncbi:MAG: translocation/assembly module TamB domain-containing protein [Bacteroidales bacterium]|nr:translocation/assembly module TamB domain-containing protein [Bacteroidales bacterium]